MKTPFLISIVCLAATGLPSRSAEAAGVSTADGSGADVEMVERNDPTAARIGSATLNTRWNGSDRNEVVGLRFDLSGYLVSSLSNVALRLVNYRTNTSRVIDVYGVARGVSGGTGTYTTETWDDLAVQAWGDLPGLLVSDGSDTTLSIDTSNLTLLVDNASISNFDEGSVEAFASAALTEFVRTDTGSPLITLLLTQGGSGSGGQFRFASREATELATPGLFTGVPGTFAPALVFDAPASALRITRAVQTGEGLALAGEGGLNRAPFDVVRSADVTQPLSNWSVVATGAFDGAGGFAVTSPVLAQAGSHYFGVKVDDVPHDPGPVGFATVNGGITGGEGGVTQTVSTVSAFVTAAAATSPRVIRVDGVLDLDGNGTGSANIHSDKTLLGVGTQAAIVGQLQISAASNVIVRNLTLSNQGAPSTLDGIRIVNGAHHVWVDHCTFVDCADGEVDITVGSDYVTVSWCTFMYENQTEHAFVNLIAGSDTDAGDYRITFHHNWWSTGCKQRMPMSRYGTVHLFNNCYDAPGNDYCSNARTNAQFLSEHNYYQQADDPIFKQSNGRVRTVGNVYLNCTGRIDPGLDTLDVELSPPPYPYTLDPVMDVPGIVTHGAGAGQGPFAP